MQIQSRIGEKFLFLLKPARVKGLYGGRGGAKSHSVCEVAIMKAMQSCIRVVCGREFMVSIAQSMRALLVKKIEAMGVQSRFKITESEIDVHSDRKCLLLRRFGPQRRQSEGHRILRHLHR